MKNAWVHCGGGAGYGVRFGLKPMIMFLELVMLPGSVMGLDLVSLGLVMFLGAS